MSENVHVAFGDDQGQTARALLEAAQALELDASVVSVDTEHQTFTVPEEVAKKASGVETFDPYEAVTLELADALEAVEPHDPYQGGPTAEPDHEAAAAAVGNIDPGPSPEDADAEQLEANPHTSPEPAKKAAKKAPTKKAAAKKTTTAKKAAAKKAPAKKAAAEKQEG